MRILAFICLILGIPISIIASLIVAISSGPGKGRILWPIVMFAIPFVLFIYFWMKSAGVGRKAFEQFVRQHLKKVDYSEWFDGSGIAIDVTNRKIVLARKKLQKIYDFAEIRAWRSSFHSGGTTQLFGHAGPAVQMQAGIANLGVLAGNYMESGLFLRVKDIEHPEWQITGISEQQAVRWFEILEQHLND